MTEDWAKDQRVWEWLGLDKVHSRSLKKHADARQECLNKFLEDNDKVCLVAMSRMIRDNNDFLWSIEDTFRELIDGINDNITKYGYDKAKAIFDETRQRIIDNGREDFLAHIDERIDEFLAKK